MRVVAPILMSSHLRKRAHLFTISKSFTFSASHVLSLPATHKCSRLHGHNYVVEIGLASEELDHRGFVIDYEELSDFRVYIADNLDHRHLNDILRAEPTAENIAKYLYGFAKTRWPFTSYIRIGETPGTWATYSDSATLDNHHR
jgi:6-pyruvoyltetrahydropterin/6-carboxytetrahydropterin synthase